MNPSIEQNVAYAAVAMFTGFPPSGYTNCPQCDYSLDGLPAVHACPECGFGYDADTYVLACRRHITVALSVGYCSALGVALIIAWCIPNLPAKVNLVAVVGILLSFGRLLLQSLTRWRSIRRPVCVGVGPVGIFHGTLRRTLSMIPWESIDSFRFHRLSFSYPHTLAFIRLKTGKSARIRLSADPAQSEMFEEAVKARRMREAARS